MFFDKYSIFIRLVLISTYRPTVVIYFGTPVSSFQHFRNHIEAGRYVGRTRDAIILLFMCVSTKKSLQFIKNFDYYLFIIQLIEI